MVRCDDGSASNQRSGRRARKARGLHSHGIVGDRGEGDDSDETGQGATEEQFVRTMGTAGIRVVFARELEG